jgi:hypothetical protein
MWPGDYIKIMGRWSNREIGRSSKQEAKAKSSI